MSFSKVHWAAMLWRDIFMSGCLFCWFLCTEWKTIRMRFTFQPSGSQNSSYLQSGNITEHQQKQQSSRAKHEVHSGFHPSIICTASTLRVAGGLEPIPADIGREAGPIRFPHLHNFLSTPHEDPRRENTRKLLTEMSHPLLWSHAHSHHSYISCLLDIQTFNFLIPTSKHSNARWCTTSNVNEPWPWEADVYLARHETGTSSASFHT